MTFTRQAVLLKWSSGATERAFKVLRQGYQGGGEDKPASYNRSLVDGSLLSVRAPTTPRNWSGIIAGEDSPSGSTGGVSWGSIAELKLAWAATDLQCKSFEDATYWDAEWIGKWPPQLEYDPVRNYAQVPMTLEGKD